MRKTYSIIALSIIGMNAYAQNPTILNSDFENFRTVNASTLGSNISSEVPNDWYCGDSLLVANLSNLTLAGFTGITPEEQSFADTNAASGSKAVGLKTLVLNDTLQLPGILANAKMGVNALALMGGGSLSDAITYSGGTFLDKKELKTFTAKVFSDTSNKEDASISVILYGNDPSVGEYGVIGRGAAIISPDTAYQDVSLDITYNNANFTKTDTMVIILSSTINSFVTAGNPANYVVFDKLEATYEDGKGTVSINEINQQSGIIMYPNPTSDKFVVNFTNGMKNSTYELSVVTIDGRSVLNVELSEDKTSVDISHLEVGLYIVSIRNNGALQYQGKVIKH